MKGDGEMFLAHTESGPSATQRFQYFLLRRLNPFMTALLRSRLHRWVSGNILLVTFAGRRSGRIYTTPVSYIRDDDIVTFATPRVCGWWVNLRGGATVTLLVGGHQFTGAAQVIVDEQDDKESRIGQLLRRVPRDAPYYPVRLDASGIPDPADLAAAARSHVVITVRLERSENPIRKNPIRKTRSPNYGARHDN